MTSYVFNLTAIDGSAVTVGAGTGSSLQLREGYTAAEQCAARIDAGETLYVRIADIQAGLPCSSYTSVVL